ncbi:MAG: glycosyl transferase family 2, partial [Myxococcales bacterium]|nr:glycosyl transferase family 2 [Myxococcales bacterium]
GSVLLSDLPLRVKVEAFFHLTATVSFLLMLVLSLLMPVAFFARIDRGWAGTFAMDLPLFLGATSSVCWFYALSQRRLGRSWLSQLSQLPMVLALGIGMSLNNARAVVEALVGYETGFIRTPKYDVRVGAKMSWHRKRYATRQWLQPLLELLIGLWYFPAIAYAISEGGRALLGLPFLLLFQFGYLYVSLVTFGQAFQGLRERTSSSSRAIRSA